MGGRPGDNTMMYCLSCVDKVSGRKAWGQHYDVQSVDKVSERKAWDNTMMYGL